MATTYTETSRSAEWAYDGWETRYTREFLVHSDDPLDDGGGILAWFTINVPNCDYGDGYTVEGFGDLDATLQTISVRRQATGHDGASSYFTVVATWSTKAPTGMNDKNPTSRATVWKMSFQRGTEVATQDINGIALTTSAGEPFRGLSKNKTTMTLTATKNYTPLAFATLDLPAFRDKTNDDAYTAMGMSFPAHTLLMIGADATTQHENGTDFIQANFVFAHEANEHRLQVLDEGNYYLVGANRVIPREERLGAGVGTILLDGTGGLDPGGIPFYHDFVIYQDADFDTLGL